MTCTMSGFVHFVGIRVGLTGVEPGDYVVSFFAIGLGCTAFLGDIAQRLK